MSRQSGRYCGNLRPVLEIVTLPGVDNPWLKAQNDHIIMTMVNHGGGVETLTVSKFKATCLAVLEEVHRKKKRILITKRGKPIAEVVPPGGQDQKTPLRETVTHLGDIVSPVASDEWEASR